MRHRITRPVRVRPLRRRASAAGALAAAAVLVTALAAGAGQAQTTTTVPGADTAVWPYVSSSIRYDDPVEAARGFAVDFAGFSDPVLGEFQQGDSRSGEIEIRPAAGASITTRVLLRQLGPDDTWFVLGAQSDSIVVTEPSGDALDEVRSPLALAGRASAFEGTVDVEVRQDGSTEPIGSTFVTGSGSAEPGPFSGSITFAAPTARRGALVLTEQSAGDYPGTVAATVLRIRFATTGPASSSTTSTTAAAVTTTTVPTGATKKAVAVPLYTG